MTCSRDFDCTINCEKDSLEERIATLTAERDTERGLRMAADQENDRLRAERDERAEQVLRYDKAIATLTAERDGIARHIEMLAEAIVSIGVETGITDGTLSLSGPQLLLIAAGVKSDVAALKKQVARLSAPVSDEEPDLCEGCEKPLREDEGHETEDMVMLCDECWQGMLDDPDCHSEECPCEKCIASRTAP